MLIKGVCLMICIFFYTYDLKLYNSVSIRSFKIYDLYIRLYEMNVPFFPIVYLSLNNSTVKFSYSFAFDKALKM